MERKIIIVIVAAFLAGDNEATIRARRFYGKKIKALKNENIVLKTRVNCLVQSLHDIADDDVSHEEAMNHIDTNLEFLKIVQKEL